MRSSLTRAEPSRRRPFTRGKRRSSLFNKRWGSGTRLGWGWGLEPGWYVQVRSQQSAFNELRSSKAAVALSSISSIEQQVLVSYKCLNAVFVAHRHPLLIYSPVQHGAACHHFGHLLSIDIPHLHNQHLPHWKPTKSSLRSISFLFSGCANPRVGGWGLRVASKREPVVQPVEHNQGGALSSS